MSIGLGIGNSVSGKVSGFGGGGGIDPNAQAYITAAGITDATEQAAVNQLVLDLKGTGSTPSGTDLWTDAAAFYPISPTSLSAARYNLRDTTSFNITWDNGPTHGYTGVTFNGSNQYGDTGFNPSVETLANGYDITLGMQIVNASLTAVGLMSAVIATSQRTGMLLISGNLYQDIHNTGGGRWVTSTGGTYEGRMIVSADRVVDGAGGRTNYLNGTSLGTKLSESNGTPVNLSLFVGAQNNGSGGQNFTAMEMSFGLIIPKGLDATAVTDLDDAIARYSTAARIDPDATAYITAAGITDPTEQAAVFQLVSDLKGTGSTTNNTDVWSDSDRIYPISPTSLTAAKYNLKDPTKNITWYNTPTHATTGVAGNLVDTYGDTGFIPSVDGDVNSMAITVSTATVNTINTGVAMGVYSTSPLRFVQMNLTYPAAVIGNNSDNLTGLKNTKSISTLTRDATTMNLYENNVLTDSDISLSASTLPVNPIFVLARGSVAGSPQFFTDWEFDFFGIHKSLTANQVTDLYDAITTYNTAVR